MKHLLIASLLICSSTTLWAEGFATSTPEQRATIQTRFLTEKLKLSDAQAKNLQALNLKYAEKMEPIIKGSDGVFAKRQKARPIMEARDADMQKLLGPELYAQFDGIRDDMKKDLEEKLGE